MVVHRRVCTQYLLTCGHGLCGMQAAAAAVKGEGKHDHPAGSKPAATSVAGKNSSKRAAAEPLAELKDPKKPKTKHKKSKKKQKKNKDKNRKFKKGKVPQAPASPSY